MHSVAVRALRTIRRHDLIPRGARVLGAVSGGADSVAMLLVLRELEAAGELVCAGLAHVNHRLRGDAAARDQAFCENLAAQLRLPIEIATVDVAALARQRRTSKENAARIGRYACLRDAMERLGAARVAVAHTRDDQAETFLLHAIRGAGTRGLRGIHPRRGVFVRPLLDVAREDLRAYLRDRGMSFCHDETNDDVTMLRNRVRRELMPLLADRFSPGIVRVLARNAEVASADEALLSGLAGDLLARASRPEAGGLSIDAVALAAAPDALAWRAAIDALRAVRADAPIDGPFAGVGSPSFPRLGFQHAQALVELARGRFPRVDLPGVRAERIGARLVLQKRDGRRPLGAGNSFTYALSIPGEVHLRESGCAILAWRTSLPEGGELVRMPAAPGDRNTAVVSAAALGESVTVRNRRPGDSFRPFGLGGRKKLQDFFVDRKVGRDRRDLIPLVVDHRDRIVWVAGHEISEEFRVTDMAQAVVILRLKTFFEAVGTSAADGARSKA
jgi:tRNA(Ile)-lysidine synthase